MNEKSEESKDWGRRLDILGVIYYVTGGLVAGYGGYLAIVALLEILGSGGYFAGAVLVIGSACLVFGAVLAQVGRMMRARRGRLFCLVMGCLCLPALPPIGTILGIYTVFLVTRKQVRMMFASPRKSDSRFVKYKIRILIITALVVPITLLAMFKGLESTAERKAEREADQNIVTTTDELLLRLVSQDDALRARFGRFDRMERVPFHDDPWFTRTQLFDIDRINFARIAHFASGDLRVHVEIPYPANPDLGRRGVRIDSWRIFEAHDGATGKPITILDVRPVLVAPYAAPQTTAPRVE